MNECELETVNEGCKNTLCLDNDILRITAALRPGVQICQPSVCGTEEHSIGRHSLCDRKYAGSHP